MYTMKANFLHFHVLLHLSSLATLCTSYKILMVPYMAEYNSRLMNMLKMADFLQEGGHDVSVLLHTREKHRLTNPYVKLQEIKTPDDMQMNSIQTFVDKGLDFNFFSNMKIKDVVQFITGMQIPICESALQSKMHKSLKQENFDLIILDLAAACFKILVDYIDTNVVLYSNYGSTSDPYLFYPYIPSLTCGSELGAICSTQRPTFINRLKNVLSVYVFSWWIKKPVTEAYQDLREKYNVNTSLSLSHFNRKTLLIATIDFILDTPRPLMPHVIPISGLFRTKPKPLPEDLQQFMESSGDNGVVVVSFGSAFGLNNLPRAEVLLRVLSKLKQKVSGFLLNSFLHNAAHE